MTPAEVADAATDLTDDELRRALGRLAGLRDQYTTRSTARTAPLLAAVFADAAAVVAGDLDRRRVQLGELDDTWVTVPGVAVLDVERPGR